MAQLGYGMRQLLDQIEAQLDDLIEDRFNPAAVEAHAHKLKRRLHEDIAPRLMRAEPTIEVKLKELEERYHADMQALIKRIDHVENRVIIVKQSQD
jgi:nitrate/nitrite-specific signal transduction histidine kinase